MFGIADSNYHLLFWVQYNKVDKKLQKSFCLDANFDYWPGDWSYTEYEQWLTI